MQAFSGCSSLQSIIIPDGITNIEFNAFEECTSLKSIIIPDGVTEIGMYAFRGCTDLESIEIPDSVTEIDFWPFEGCAGLKSVISTKEKEPDLSCKRIEYLLHALSGVSEEVCLRVPIGCGNAYKHYPAFEGKFKTIIADINA